MNIFDEPQFEPKTVEAQSEAGEAAPVAKTSTLGRAVAIVAGVVIAASVGAFAVARSSKPATSLSVAGAPQQQQVGNGGQGFSGPRMGGGGPHLDIVAQTIGISQSDLFTALQSGQSMAAVAQAHNVDPQKVIDALVAQERSELTSAVSSGRLTQAQVDQIEAGLTQRITARVNGTGFDGPPPGGGSGRPQQQPPSNNANPTTHI